MLYRKPSNCIEMGNFKTRNKFIGLFFSLNLITRMQIIILEYWLFRLEDLKQDCLSLNYP